MDKDINVTLKIWRQKGPKEKGQFETYQMNNINQSVSFQIGRASCRERV